MSSASNKRRRRAGTSSLEFALIAIPFVLLMVAITDLGRYFATQQELRTMTSVIARSCLLLAMKAGGGGATCFKASPVGSVGPFIDTTKLTVNSAYATNSTTGVVTVTVTTRYPFSFMLPLWTSYSGSMSDGTKMSY
jgi:Flp pilus assembly protein TadG